MTGMIMYQRPWSIQTRFRHARYCACDGQSRRRPLTSASSRAMTFSSSIPGSISTTKVCPISVTKVSSIVVPVIFDDSDGFSCWCISSKVERGQQSGNRWWLTCSRSGCCAWIFHRHPRSRGGVEERESDVVEQRAEGCGIYHDGCRIY